MEIALPEPHTPEPEREDRTLLLDCRDLAYQLKNDLKKLEGYSNLWDMADVIYRDLAERAQEKPLKEGG